MQPKTTQLSERPSIVLKRVQSNYICYLSTVQCLFVHLWTRQNQFVLANSRFHPVRLWQKAKLHCMSSMVWLFFYRSSRFIRLCETKCKISVDCQRGDPGFNSQPGRGLNFGRPSFSTLSVESDVKLFFQSLEMISRGLKRTQTVLENSSVVIPVFGAVVRGHV